MIAAASTEVLVVGAGPAGAVAATALARRGIPVVLAGDITGMGAHDVLVSAQAVRGLSSLGVDVTAFTRPVDVMCMRLGAKPREVSDLGSAVCSRARLLGELRRAAGAAGATPIHGRVTSLTGRPGGCLAVIDAAAAGASPALIEARHVVAATGAAAGDLLRPGGAPHTVGVGCARRFIGAEAGARMLLVLVPSRAAGPNEPPICAWMLPGSNGTVTVGAAKVGGHALPDPPDLLRDAVNALADADIRLASIRPIGPLVSGPLDTGFTPGRVAAADHLPVGDAAGLVNPFTGEGLSYAIQSGMLAADAVALSLSDPVAARRSYARLLAATFVGYFETARHAVRRHYLAWRILDAGADSDHPFFAKGRRAILMPEGLTALTPVERLGFADADAGLVGPFLIACDEVAIATIRQEWPFLARLVMTGDSLAHQLRPALLFFAALLAEGRMPDVGLAVLGAAIELATLGALAFLGPQAAPHPPGRGVDWAMATTVLAGDFLLSQAARLVAESAPDVSWSFSDWLAELAALRAARLDRTSAVAAGAVFASLLEFPARIGALAGGGSPGTIQALRDVGLHCGHAFLHAEDILALRGKRTRLDTTLKAMIDGCISAITESLAGQAVTAGLLATSPELRSQALAAATAACREHRGRALDAIAAVPAPASARMLRQFVRAVAAPADVPAGDDA